MIIVFQYRFTRKRKSKSVLVKDEKDGINSVKSSVTTCAMNNNAFYPSTPNIFNVNPSPFDDISAVDGDNRFDVIVENNVTVINVQQLNININKHATFEYDDADYNRTAGGKKNDPPRAVFVMDLEKIYWDKWRDYVARKISGRKNRCEKIDSFLMKIQEKLNADQMKRSKTSNHRGAVPPKQAKTAVYDRQQAKIENQKKLLEKQRDEINRLKLKQLKLESEKAMIENQAIFDRTYRKSEKMSKIKNNPHSNSALAVKTASPSDILNRMEIRALDRQAKWEAIKKRRREMELENQRKKHELEQRCLKERMEQKRKELFAARENLRLKRIEECKEQMERDILRQNIKIADDFYRKLLMRKALEAFKINLKNRRLSMEKASDYCNKKIREVCFGQWRFFVNNNSNKRLFMAEQFYKQKLMKTAFLGFSKVYCTFTNIVKLNE